MIFVGTSYDQGLSELFALLCHMTPQGRLSLPLSLAFSR